MKITKQDLIGEIKDFPIEVVEKMIEKQVEQGNEADVSVFQVNATNGFIWGKTTEGHIFWSQVIKRKNFELFFKKYPKYPKVMEVSDDGVKWCRRVVFMEKVGLYLAWVFAETIEDAEEETGTHPWKYARDIQQPLTITKTEIAEKFGVSADRLIIKD